MIISRYLLLFRSPKLESSNLNRGQLLNIIYKCSNLTKYKMFLIERLGSPMTRTVEVFSKRNVFLALMFLKVGSSVFESDADTIQL